MKKVKKFINKKLPLSRLEYFDFEDTLKVDYLFPDKNNDEQIE